MGGGCDGGVARLRVGWAADGEVRRGGVRNKGAGRAPPSGPFRFDGGSYPSRGKRNDHPSLSEALKMPPGIS